jgi:cell division ATPase FtsA
MGFTELAAEVFQVPARLGLPGEEIGERLRTWGYSTVLGTLAAGWEMETQMPKVSRPRIGRRVLRAMDYVLGAEKQLQA